MDAFKLRNRECFDFRDEETVVEALVAAFASAARRAFARGLLHGYRTEEETLHTVRGRIRVGEQIRRRFDIPVPVEVRYDDFTDDVLMNRLVKAAAARLSLMRIRSPRSRADLGWIDARLGNVALVEFSPNAVPDVSFNRLNGHYREVVMSVNASISAVESPGTPMPLATRLPEIRGRGPIVPTKHWSLLDDGRLGCKFCQNHDISKIREMDRLQAEAPPEAIAASARRLGCRSVAFTYNDPVIYHEHAADIADACREVGVKTVAVTAGYVTDSDAGGLLPRHRRRQRRLESERFDTGNKHRHNSAPTRAVSDRGTGIDWVKPAP